MRDDQEYPFSYPEYEVRFFQACHSKGECSRRSIGNVSGRGKLALGHMPLRSDGGRRNGGVVVIWGSGFSFIRVLLDTRLRICQSIWKCQKSVGIIWLLVGKFLFPHRRGWLLVSKRLCHVLASVVHGPEMLHCVSGKAVSRVNSQMGQRVKLAGCNLGPPLRLPID